MLTAVSMSAIATNGVSTYISYSIFAQYNMFGKLFSGGTCRGELLHDFSFTRARIWWSGGDSILHRNHAW